MGNICNGNHEKEETSQTVDTFNKNYPICQFVLKKLVSIDLILGTYRCHKSDLLLVIVQADYIEYSTELRDYSQNFAAVIDSVSQERKKLINVTPSRNCPYKRIQLCILPKYQSQDSETYNQQFLNMSQQILASYSDITLQINHTFEKVNGLPNQTLIALFLKTIIERPSKPLKISVLSNETKLLNMVRYEIVKLQDYTVNSYIDKETRF